MLFIEEKVKEFRLDDEDLDFRQCVVIDKDGMVSIGRTKMTQGDL